SQSGLPSPHLYYLLVMLFRRLPRSTLFPTRRSSDLDGIQVPSLSVSSSRSFIGKASQNPKTGVERVCHQSVVNGFAVSNEFFEVLLVFEEIHKANANLHTLPFRLRYLAGQGLRFLYCPPCGGHVLQLHVHIA